MKYRLRLNGNPEIEAPVEHVEEINEGEVIVKDAGTFAFQNVTIEKIELIGEDDEVYAMRRLPAHLTFVLTESSTLGIQFKLSIIR